MRASSSLMLFMIMNSRGFGRRGVRKDRKSEGNWKDRKEEKKIEKKSIQNKGRQIRRQDDQKGQRKKKTRSCGVGGHDHIVALNYETKYMTINPQNHEKRGGRERGG